MFRIMLLLCYSLIDTNTIPFYFSLSQIGRVESHTQRFGLTVSFRRKLLTLRQLSHGQNICFYFADASARTSSDTASTCLDGYYLYCETKSKLLNIRIKLLNVTNASIYGFVNIQYCYIYAKFPIVSSSFFI